MDTEEFSSPSTHVKENLQGIINESATLVQSNVKEESDGEDIEFIEEVTRVVAISTQQQQEIDRIQSDARKIIPISNSNKKLRVKYSETEESGNEERGEKGYTRLQKELNRLHFVNPGEKLNCPDIKEGRRLRRRVIERTSKQSFKNQQRRPEHDRDGKFIRADGSTVDLCDCLDPSCKGCFWPCKSCESRMCGSICRAKRKGVVAYIEIPGARSEIIARHPFLDEFNET